VLTRPYNPTSNPALCPPPSPPPSTSTSPVLPYPALLTSWWSRS
jgi:hypothetical protein